jgi:hypothetical protein
MAQETLWCTFKEIFFGLFWLAAAPIRSYRSRTMLAKFSPEKQMWIRAMAKGGAFTGSCRELIIPDAEGRRDLRKGTVDVPKSRRPILPL